ncbi:unnamed protein product, partial [Allacma fusca]
EKRKICRRTYSKRLPSGADMDCGKTWNEESK